MAEKKRLDVYLFESEMAESREKAKALIMAGEVFVDGNRCDKPSFTVNDGQSVVVKEASAFVSRGGKKLEKALSEFNIDLTGKTAIDVGASTGGFTDCMLKSGALFVYAVDVGHGQLAWSLRQDSRVKVMERTNARYLKRDMFEREINFASVDVSFISLKLILPVLAQILTPPYEIAALIKPQFEAGKEKVGKKGVVRDPEVHTQVIADITDFAKIKGFVVCGITYSPIKGPEGNIEYLAYFKDQGISTQYDIAAVVARAHNRD